MENLFLGRLNNDQVDNLAKLCFDLAKGAFLIGLFPLASLTPINIVTVILYIVSGLLFGIAFTYVGLLLLHYRA